MHSQTYREGERNEKAQADRRRLTGRGGQGDTVTEPHRHSLGRDRQNERTNVLLMKVMELVQYIFSSSPRARKKQKKKKSKIIINSNKIILS